MPPARRQPAKKAAAAAEGPGNGRTLNLDASRAARLETKSEAAAPSLEFGGDVFALPVELPADFAILAMQGDLGGAVTELLGDHAEQFWKWKPSVDDLEFLIDGVNGLYGVDKGEALASQGS